MFRALFLMVAIMAAASGARAEGVKQRWVGEWKKAEGKGYQYLALNYSSPGIGNGRLYAIFKPEVFKNSIIVYDPGQKAILGAFSFNRNRFYPIKAEKRKAAIGDLRSSDFNAGTRVLPTLPGTKTAMSVPPAPPGVSVDISTDAPETELTSEGETGADAASSATH